VTLTRQNALRPSTGSCSAKIAPNQDQTTRSRLGRTRNLSLELKNVGCRKPHQRDEEDQRHYVGAHSMLEIIGIVFL
jgi:hypothetical protein